MVRIILIFILTFFSFSALSQVDCLGKVFRVALHIDNGILIVGLGGGPHAAQLCSISNTYNDVSPEVCKVLYTSLLATRAADKQTLIRFYDFNSCQDENLNWKAAGRLGWSEHMVE